MIRVVCVVLALLLPRAAGGQVSIWSGEEGSLTLTGYVQSLSGVYRPPSVTGSEERSSWQGLHGGVGRLAWTASLGSGVVVEMHDRIVFRTGSDLRGPGGLGVSVVPERTVDLSTTLLEEESLRLRHDLDRLSVTVYTGWADLTVGRQAIQWGSAVLFPVSDLFGRFSPFELDTEQKPGVDALRALSYPWDGVELDVVVADAGEGEGLSAAVHAVVGREWGDLTLGVGRFWDELILLGGVTRILENSTLRLEGALPRSLDRDAWQRPRITAGVDRLSARWSLTAELHLNGIGVPDPERYPVVLGSEAVARGESYLLGRRYAGAAGSWSPDEGARARLLLSFLANLDDGSVVWSPAASYDLGQVARLGVGGVVGRGAAPALAGAEPSSPLPESEFGSYGSFGYLQLSLYF